MYMERMRDEAECENGRKNKEGGSESKRRRKEEKEEKGEEKEKEERKQKKISKSQWFKQIIGTCTCKLI